MVKCLWANTYACHLPLFCCSSQTRRRCRSTWLASWMRKTLACSWVNCGDCWVAPRRTLEASQPNLWNRKRKKSKRDRLPILNLITNTNCILNRFLQDSLRLGMLSQCILIFWLWKVLIFRINNVTHLLDV